MEYFHVANGQLPQDAMHILLEGVIPYSLKLMLKSFVNRKKYFSLDLLNEQIFCFNFSRTEFQDKPAQFTMFYIQKENFVKQVYADSNSVCITY